MSVASIGLDAASTSRRWRITALAVVALLLAWLFIRNAWVADDAYITFRSVEQLFAGNGPRWNPHERVQVFTHPLWFGLLAVTRAVSRDLYWNSLALSFLVTSAAVFAARRVPGLDLARWLVAVAVLASSKAFVDYAWSGLETPLTYLLLAWLLAVFLRSDQDEVRQRAGWLPDVATLALIAGLLALNHPDLFLLAAPALAHSIWLRRRSGPVALLRSLALGFAPAMTWALFATVYYGTPIPNTAYAKLNHGIPDHELWTQGLRYVTETARWDPVTIFNCAAVLPAMLRAERWRWIGCGIAVHTAYIVKIGGDFMFGRLFAPAFFVSAVFAATVVRRRSHQMALLAALAVLNLVVPYSPIRLPRHFVVKTLPMAPETYGIVDEKSVYFEERSFLQRLELPPTPAMVDDRKVSVVSMIGLNGYAAGLDQILVDGHALSDPLLARLPAVRPWRPGHFWRARPEGYDQSLLEGVNLVKNPQMRRLYEDVRTVTQGPLFSRARFAAMFRLQFATERPECIDPPCRELRLHASFPLADYRPRFFAGGGRILSSDRAGATIKLKVASSLPSEARGQQVFVITTEPVASSELSHTAAQDSEETAQASEEKATPRRNDFLITLNFSDRCQAERAAQTLCLATKSIDTRTMALQSSNEICSRLVFGESGVAAQAHPLPVPPTCEAPVPQRPHPRRRNR